LKYWIKEEEKILTRLVKKGVTLDEICSVLKDRSREAIQRKALRLGLDLKPKAYIDYNRLVELEKLYQ